MARRFLSNVRINDAYTLPASDGTNNQVIKTDGSGNLTFGQLATDSASVIYKDTFTGDGSTTAFTMANALNDENQSNIYIDGVYQSKSTYSVANKVITFSTAPASGHAIEVISTTGINSGPTAIFTDNFTANGSTTAFTLGQTVHDENQTLVFLNGVYQFKNTYTLSGTTLTLDTAPANGVAIEVMSIGSAYSGGDILYDHDFTSAGLMKTNGSGTYSIVTDNSSNWNTAYTYSQVGHLPLAGGTVSGNLIVTGDLTINGNTTTLSTQTIEVEDNILQLNTTQGTPDTATAATSGISIYRGNGVTQASFIFDDGDDTWDLTNNLTVAGNIRNTSGQILPNELSMGDNKKILIGNGDDLQLYHNGTTSNSNIENYTGGLYITNYTDDGNIIFRSDNGSGGITDYFYLDGSATKTIFAQSTQHADNAKAGFGAASDLQIYHDGSHNYIDTNNGNIYFRDDADNNIFTVYREGGGIQLSEGDLKIPATSKLYLDGGGNTYIFEESADNVIHYVGGQNKLRFNSTGTILNDAGLALDFRVEGDTDPNLFFVDGSADKVGISTNSPSALLDVGDRIHLQSDGVLKWGASANAGNLTWDTGVAIVGSQSGIDLDLRAASGKNILFKVSSSEKMRLDSSGNVGIGGSPEGNAKLDIKMSGVSQYLKLERSSSSGRSQIQFADENGGEVWRVGMTGGGGEDFVFWDGSANVLILDRSNNQAQFNNDVIAYYSSDKRLKENVKNIESPLEKLNKINGVEFDWIKKEGVHGNKGHDVGVIAQEIEEVLPEVVTTRDNGYKAVKYEKIVPLLIEAIKEQQQQINELKEKLNG